MVSGIKESGKKKNGGSVSIMNNYAPAFNKKNVENVIFAHTGTSMLFAKKDMVFGMHRT